jgi:hypothetical protein
MAAATLTDRTISQSAKRRFSGAFLLPSVSPGVSGHTSIDGIKADFQLCFGAPLHANASRGKPENMFRL